MLLSLLSTVVGMPFVRAIGRWTMTALVINSIIGSAIFGIPSELTRLVGRASPIAMVVGGVATALIAVCLAELSSQFSEHGGIYLYVRTALGRFAGTQVAWFYLLSPVAAGAANASLFAIYLGGLFPWIGQGLQRVVLLGVLISIPTIANYVGVRSGAKLANTLTVAKLLPLALVIALGVARFGWHPQLIHTREITEPGVGAWLSALLLLIFAYSGFENALIPAGEVEHPRRTVPFGLAVGLVGCIVVYALVQFVTVATIGSIVTTRPVADMASVLMGPGGRIFATVAVMISTYGWLSGGILNVPRLACSLGAQGDAPASLGKLHPRFNTPSRAIVIYATLVWLLAATGAYLFLVAVNAGAVIVYYSLACAALIRLRRTRPRAPALRVPFGQVIAILAICIWLVALTRLHAREALLVGITAAVATAHWWCAKPRDVENQRRAETLEASAE